jgi:WD40 repeat protein
MRIAPILLLSAAACVSAKTNPEAPPTGVYVGFFTENAQESIFFPCGTRLAEDGWWLRFKEGIQADKARYQYRGAGFPNSSHDIRVIATLSKPGRYGTGFHTRELVVEKLLDVKNPGEICQGYNPKPAKYNGAGAVESRVIAAATSDDRTLVAAMGVKGDVSIWKTKDGSLTTRFRVVDAGLAGYGLGKLAISPNDSLIAIAGADGYVRIWGISDGEERLTLKNSVGEDTIGAPGAAHLIRGNSFPVSSISFSPDGAFLVSTGGFRAYAWSLSSGAVADSLWGPPNAHYRVPAFAAFAKDPSRIIAAVEGPELQVYSPGHGSPIWIAPAPFSRVNSMKLSEDGRWLAMSTGQDSVTLWSLNEGRVTHQFSVPSFAMGGIAFSPDGNVIAISGGQFAIYLWNTRTGEPIRSIHGLSHWARDIWFTARGDSIVASSAMDSTLSVFPLSRRLIDLRGELRD